MISAPTIKICGLTRRSDAELAAAAGADYGGAILAPNGKRSITAEAAAEIFADLPLNRVGVFVDASVEETSRAARAARLDVLQLHGQETAETIRALRSAGSWVIWKAIRLRDPDDLTRALERFDGIVDGLLIDGWSPVAPGGTGTSFDWDALASTRAHIPDTLPLILAGGLNSGNVARAIALLRPSVVDVSSGVELSPGVKDPAAVPAFIAAARGLSS
ncbi:MAG: phosphoribosylanthranilate isomerase [Gemmatimonadetes bacterium]|nr:phosphoribosylanthranilate isomerase [Gemmatimonadota bacterium]